MKAFLVVPALTLLVGIALPAIAQQAPSQPMQGQSMQGMQNMSGMQNMNPTQKEFMAAMDRMNKDMMQGMMESDVDRSWMMQMIAHHQGAVDMSEIVLKQTKDADVIKEARKTKEENEKSIKVLQAKLRKEK